MLNNICSNRIIWTTTCRKQGNNIFCCPMHFYFKQKTMINILNCLVVWFILFCNCIIWTFLNLPKSLLLIQNHPNSVSSELIKRWNISFPGLWVWCCMSYVTCRSGSHVLPPMFPWKFVKENNTPDVEINFLLSIKGGLIVKVPKTMLWTKLTY